MVDERLDSLIGNREDWLSGAAMLALLAPALHPLVRDTLGVGSHLLWILHVFPAAVFAYRYGRRGAAVLLPLSPALLLAGERLFGAGYGTPAPWETAISLAVSVGFANLLVAGFALSARHRREALAHSAEHDALTDLPNRRWLRERLQEKIARMEADGGHGFALAFVDLDRFARVNDSLGHAVGDQVLRSAAGRLSSAVRGQDVVARVGGDEFLVLFDDVSREDAALQATRHLLEAIRDEPIRAGGHSVVVTASAGVVLSRSDYDRPEEIIRDADAALVEAEREAPGSVLLFRQEMHARARQRLELEGELRRALAEDELELHFQPIVRADNRDLRGAEALLRWRHPERGLVVPGDFLPLVATSDLLEPVGRRVLDEAVRHAEEWAERSPEVGPFVMSVNVSARQLNRPAFVDIAAERAAELESAGGILELELTEEVLMEDAPSARDALLRLRREGARFAVDDFGTGYSSLRYLHELPVDTLKIDRTFVQSRPGAEGDPAIARTIATLAEELGLETVAEGVESQEDRRQMALLGCDCLQGYWFGHPLPAPGFESRHLGADRFPPRRDLTLIDAAGVV